MSKHKAIPKKIRERVFRKYDGHCAYCGCQLTMKTMQVDHINAVYLHQDVKHDMTDEEINNIDNLMPSCRQCNLYKSTMSVEDFRQQLETTLYANATKSFQFRLAEKYGLVQRNPHKIQFYFETCGKEKSEISVTTDHQLKSKKICEKCQKYQTEWCPNASIDLETGFADEYDKSDPNGYCSDWIEIKEEH